MKVQRRDSMKTKLILFTGTVTFLIIVLLSAISIYSIQKSTTQALEKSAKEATKLVSDRIEDQIQVFLSLAENLDLFVDQVRPYEAQLEKYISALAEKNGVTRMHVLGPDGRSLTEANGDYGDNETYRQAAGKGAGGYFLSDPINRDQEVYFEFAYIGNKCGVLMEIPYQIFGDIVADVRMGKTGSTYILNNRGAKVAHDDFSMVQNQHNNLELVKNDPKTYKTVAAIETKMVEGKTGFGFYVWAGNRKFGSYDSIQGTNGWSVNVTAFTEEFMAEAAKSTVRLFIVGVLCLMGAVAAIIVISNGFINPIQEIQKVIALMAEGSLNAELQVKNTRNEVGIIATELNHMCGAFRAMILDISRFMEALSNGDLSAEIQQEYAGDFNGIKRAMLSLQDNLNNVMSGIHASSDEVANGSQQVSFGAQTLSQGATEQASSIEELAAAINEISSQVEYNAQSAQQANEQAAETAGELENGKKQMNRMTEAMQRISDASLEIGKIIKTIEDIAFQTNILALNAAVEAARAGAAGKGFAVVADEVRNLASKSAEASKNTASLIETTIQAVQDGASIAASTGLSLEHIISSSEKSAMLVKDIARECQEQSQSIAQVTQGVDQISSVVQTNSATAQESAAASEQLSGQAQLLKELVGRFQLNA